MDMNEFYEKYNLSKSEFSIIMGSSVRTLEKFANGEKIRESSRRRIEIAMRVIEENNLVRPKYDGPRWGYYVSTWHSSRYCAVLCEYRRTVRELIEKEDGV